LSSYGESSSSHTRDHGDNEIPNSSKCLFPNLSKKTANSGNVNDSGQDDNSSLDSPFNKIPDISSFIEIARMLVSLIYAWGLDKNLDEICLTTLRLVRPNIPLCFGVISKKRNFTLLVKLNFIFNLRLCVTIYS
jgi:hypothetical protein